MLGTKNINKPYNITLIRIILTVLENLQNELLGIENSSFFVQKEQSVSIRKLYEYISIFCTKDTFLNCIKNMFAGRTWTYWNHLITFDNIINYSSNDLKKALSYDSVDEDVYIRCTTAGECYLSNFCIHYEFFACRYVSKKYTGLFSQSYKLNNGKYSFEKQIRLVLDNVINCCEELKKVNNNILEYLGYTEYEELLDSYYVKDRSFHEERIIHNHITYLDSFRLFLINGSLKNDVVNVNKIIIKFIEEYLNLLKYENDSFYSANSEKLYEELMACINKIIDKEYNDRTIVISRTYYRDNP